MEGRKPFEKKQICSRCLLEAFEQRFPGLMSFILYQSRCLGGLSLLESLHTFSSESETMEWYWTSIGSLFATLMFLRSTIMQYLPLEVQHFLRAQLAALFIALRGRTHTIRIHEYITSYSSTKTTGANELFTAVRSHLSSHCSTTAPLLLLSKDHLSPTITSTLPASHSTTDSFNGITLHWRFTTADRSTGSSPNGDFFDLSFHRRHTDTIHSLYIPHLLAEANRRRFETRERCLFTNRPGRGFDDHHGLWSAPVAFTHPSTFDSIALDPALRDDIISDLLRFTSRGDYYKRAGRAWKRGYLLYGPPGTGKTSLIAAIANFLKFDVYDIELTTVTSNTQLRKLLVSTTSRSVIIIEDVDCSLDLSDRAKKSKLNRHMKYPGDDDEEQAKVSLSGVLNFVDGLWSSCVGERLMIFTTNHREKLDPALLRPGRMDRQILLSYCGPAAFRTLAKNYLEVEEGHPMMAEAEALITEVKMTPAEVAEVLLGCEDDGGDAGMKKVVEEIRRRKVEAQIGAAVFGE